MMIFCLLLPGAPLLRPLGLVPANAIPYGNFNPGHYLLHFNGITQVRKNKLRAGSTPWNSSCWGRDPEQ